MGIITVEGLGQVEISGDVPTPEEAGKIKRAALSLQSRPTAQPATPSPAVAAPPTAEFTPEQIETAGFGDLAQTMRGFQGLEAPVGREFWGDYEHPLQSEFVRPLAAGVSALPRGVLKGALAGAEVVAGRPYAPELVELEQSWKDWEVGLTEGGRPEDDDIYAVLGKAKGGDFAPLLSLVGRGMVQASPGMYAAVQNMPAYMGTLIGDYAERAAADRGSDSIEFNDLSRGIAMAGAVAGIEKASALKALSGAGASTVKGAAARGALIEGGEEYTQQHLENIGIQAGSDRPGFLGVDWAEGHKGGIHGLAIGAPMGGLMGGGAAMRRNDTIGELGRRIADVPARREARLLQEVADLEAEAAPVAEEVAPVVAEEAVALEPAPVLTGADGLPLRLYVGTAHEGELRPEGGHEYGIYLTPRRKYAQLWARETGGKLREFTARVRNPLFVDSKGEISPKDLTKEDIDKLREQGYDAIVSTSSNLDTAHEVVLFDTGQLGPVAEEVAPVVAEEAVTLEPAEPSPAEPVVAAVIEEVDTPTGTVTGYRDQVAPPPLPIEAIDEQAQAIEVQMEKDRLAAQVREARKAAEEAAKEREVAPRPSGAKLRAVVDKGAKRRRVEEIDTPPEPMSAKDAIRRLAMVANESRSTEADVTDAVNEAAAAELRESGQAIAPRNADNIDRIKQLAREMGRTDEEIDQLLSHQKMSFADVITAMDDAGLRSKLSEDGTDVEIPAATETLITEVNESRLSPTNTQIAAIHAAYRATSTARANVLLAAEQATDSKEIAKLAATDAKLRALALNALLAQKRGGTPAAQAMRFRQYLIDPVMNVVEAQARATLKKRKPLTSQEVARLERLWDAAEKAESQAAEAETKAQKALKKATRRLKSAENALRASGEVQKEAKKKARKPKKEDGKEKAPRQKAAEIEGAPIRVTPIKKSARQKELEKAFKATQKEARKAADGVQKAKAKTRKAQRAKGAVPEATVNKWLARYRKAFGGALVLNSSGDNSALGRQALGLAIQMPATAWQTIPVALSAAPWRAGHRKYALDKQLELLSSPNQGLRDFADLEMTEVEGRSNIDDETDPHRAREEAWMFRAFETGMLADVLVQPSQNIFGLTLNILRTEAFDEGARLVAEVNGVNLADMRKADLRGAPDGSKEKQFANDIKALGLLVNVSTGRGTFNAKALGVARHLMFAPRYTMSRFELPWRALELAAGKGKFSDVSPEARALFMRRAKRQMSWAMGMMVMSGIAAAYNDDDAVEAMDNFFNPENADFLKMRIGDYHIDTMQGLGATWRYVWPFVFSPIGATKDLLVKGELPDAHVPWRKEHLAPLKQLSRNKLAPLVSWLVKVGRGTDWRGRDLESIPASERGSYKAGLNPDNVKEATMAYALDRVVFPTLGLVTPIGVQQMAEAFGRDATAEQKSAFQKGIPIVLNFFGISAAHYKDRAKKGKSLGLPGLPRPPSVPRPPLTRFD